MAPFQWQCQVCSTKNAKYDMCCSCCGRLRNYTPDCARLRRANDPKQMAELREKHAARLSEASEQAARPAPEPGPRRPAESLPTPAPERAAQQPRPRLSDPVKSGARDATARPRDRSREAISREPARGERRQGRHFLVSFLGVLLLFGVAIVAAGAGETHALAAWRCYAADALERAARAVMDDDELCAAPPAASGSGARYAVARELMAWVGLLVALLGLRRRLSADRTPTRAVAPADAARGTAAAASHIDTAAVTDAAAEDDDRYNDDDAPIDDDDDERPIVEDVTEQRKDGLRSHALYYYAHQQQPLDGLRAEDYTMNAPRRLDAGEVARLARAPPERQFTGA